MMPARAALADGSRDCLGGRGGSALIVEDDLDLRSLLVLMVAATGMRVRAAGDGERGLTLFRQVMPDVVVTDIGLPRLGGLDLCRAIRAEEGRATPIIIFSSADRDAEVEAVLGLGGISFVDKVAGVEGLLRALPRGMEAGGLLRDLEPGGWLGPAEQLLAER